MGKVCSNKCQDCKPGTVERGKRGPGNTQRKKPSRLKTFEAGGKAPLRRDGGAKRAEEKMDDQPRKEKPSRERGRPGGREKRKGPDRTKTTMWQVEKRPEESRKQQPKGRKTRPLLNKHPESVHINKGQGMSSIAQKLLSALRQVTLSENSMWERSEPGNTIRQMGGKSLGLARKNNKTLPISRNYWGT